jgi:hypothetical protein
MRKRLPLIIWLIVAGLLIYYFTNIYQLLSKSYYVDESKLYKVDTFHLYNRAYQQSDYGGGKFSHYYPKLVFESTNGYSFAIDKYIFEAVTDKKKLEDALMYDGLKFTAFTDKENFDKFRKYSYPVFIRVYQIQIGDTKYVDIQRMNEITKGNIKRGVIIPPAFILFLAFQVLKNPDWWTKQKVIIWCIVFFTTITGLLLLT